MLHQRLFSLHLASDRALPYLPEADASEAPDVVITTGVIASKPHLRFDPWAPSSDAQFHRVEHADGTFRFTYEDGTQIVLDRGAISMAWVEPLTFEDACTYLVGAPFALLLRMRGIACIHASCVQWAGRTWAFVGASGSGKSTLAAALVDRDATLVTDDLLAIVLRDGKPHVLPSYSGIKLWPSSVELLRSDPEALPRITPTWDKRILESPVPREGSPLSGVIFLDRERSELTPAVVAMQLIANSYRPDLMTPQWRADEFATLTSVATTVDARCIAPHPVLDTIVAELEQTHV